MLRERRRSDNHALVRDAGAGLGLSGPAVECGACGKPKDLDSDQVGAASLHDRIQPKLDIYYGVLWVRDVTDGERRGAGGSPENNTGGRSEPCRLELRLPVPQSAGGVAAPDARCEQRDTVIPRKR